MMGEVSEEEFKQGTKGLSSNGKEVFSPTSYIDYYGYGEGILVGWIRYLGGKKRYFLSKDQSK